MPTISKFFGISIRMYYDDHPPPHFHAYYAEDSAKIEIATLGVIPMPSLVSVKALDDYQLDIAFSDGSRGVVSLKDRLFGPVFEPLRDVALFRQVTIDEYGAPCWPNGADLAPDALYETVRSATVPS